MASYDGKSRNATSIGAINAAADNPANPVPMPAPMPAKIYTIILIYSSIQSNKLYHRALLCQPFAVDFPILKWYHILYENNVCVPWKHLPQRNGGIYDERRLEKAGDIRKIRYRLRRDVRARSGQSRLSRRAEKLKEHDVPTFPHYSKQVRKTDYDKYDLFIGMDDKNVAYLKNLFAPDEKRR